MSNSRLRPVRAERPADAGMTLPELLIVVSIMGMLAAVISAAITVTFRNIDESEGRVNVARAEQSLDTWLPADLASTDVTDLALPAIDTDPAASPCGNCGALDLSGANALQLAWTTTLPGPVDVVTRIQYQYIEVGTEWQLQRVECVGGQQCSMNIVLHDLEAPPDPATFNPDTDSPTWVMDVAAPTDPPSLGLSDNARRIVVTVDGGGDAAGAGGGSNSINLTAGGATTAEIDADEFTVPSFVRARSRCGGPVTLIIDDSGSITQANVDNVVRPGATAFIEAFRGTPTQIQVVQFSNQAVALGPGAAWHKYADMTVDAEVDDLISSLGVLTANGATNWEEGFFHTLKEVDGSTAATLPNRVVFFTDGVPTVNRTTPDNFFGGGRDFSNGPVLHFNDGPYNGSWPTENGGSFHQESWDRADVILDQYRGIDLIFVGVGNGLNNNATWQHDPAVYQDASIPPPAGQTFTGADTLAYLLANGPSGEIPAIYDPVAGEYTNAETANFYLQSDFDATKFAAAMKAAALKDCGGTLTVQTRFPDGTYVDDEFVYENVEYRDDTGTPIAADPRRVTTSDIFRTGTFDFEIPSTSAYFMVDVVPQELQTLDGYTFQSWSCRAGAVPKTGADMTSIPISSSSWEGFTVKLKANEAVSCVMEVSQP